jgi:hypothetical protein
MMMQKMMRSGAALALALVIGACGPSINKAYKADIDARAAALKTGTASFAAPSAFTPMPLAVGQWAEYHAVDEDGQASFMTMKIVGQQGNAFWFENENKTYYGTTASLTLMEPGDRTNIDSIKILAARSMDASGTVQETPPELIGMMQSMLKKSLSALVVSWEHQPQENASVPAGTFTSCFKFKSEVSIMGMHMSSMAWGHPEVPISGNVKSEGIDHKHTMTLVSFGTSGAKSVFPGM